MREAPFLPLGGLFCLCVVPRLAEALWQGDGAHVLAFAAVLVIGAAWFVADPADNTPSGTDIPKGDAGQA